MSLIHHAASNSLWVFLGRVSERIVRLIVVMYLARLIGPSKFGIYTLAFAIAEFNTFKTFCEILLFENFNCSTDLLTF